MALLSGHFMPYKIIHGRLAENPENGKIRGNIDRLKDFAFFCLHACRCVVELLTLFSVLELRLIMIIRRNTWYTD
jgi:hypothetical protein